MKERGDILIFRNRMFFLAAIALMSGFISVVQAQVLPPRPVIVTANPAQPLSFGAFSPGADGWHCHRSS